MLGGGGVLGAAWMVGALSVLQDELGVDLREMDEMVGTSAGSVLAALLGAGVSVEDLRRHQLGEPLDHGPLAGFHWDYDNATGGDLPERPRARLGSRRPDRAQRAAPAPAAADRGAVRPAPRGSRPPGQRGRARPARGPRADGCSGTACGSSRWTTSSGQRVCFGASDAPQADLADAVMASCAIPGWYQPVRIGGRRYIDGGAWSATSVDLMAGLDLAEVYVVAPMVSFAIDRPAQLTTRLERRWRARVTRRCLHEVATVHRDGAEVTVVGPGPRDLESIGGNLMDVGRRELVLRTALETTPVALHDAAVLGEPHPDSAAG